MRDAIAPPTVTNMDFIEGRSADGDDDADAPDEKRATTAPELADAVRRRVRLASMRTCSERGASKSEKRGKLTERARCGCAGAAFGLKRRRLQRLHAARVK
jgi:hypothetical protein